MRLAQADTAVEEQRVEAGEGRPLRHAARAGVRELVRLADDEGVEGEPAFQRRHPVGARLVGDDGGRARLGRAGRQALRQAPFRRTLPVERRHRRGVVGIADRRGRVGHAALRDPQVHAPHRRVLRLPQHPQSVAVVAVHPIAHEARGQQDNDLVALDPEQRHLPEPTLVLAVADLFPQTAPHPRPTRHYLRGCLGGQRADLLFHSSHLLPDRCPLRGPGRETPTTRERATRRRSFGTGPPNAHSIMGATAGPITLRDVSLAAKV